MSSDAPSRPATTPPPADPPSPGPARVPSDARAALLASARQELDVHGASGLSLRAVARRVGVSHAAPKYHFTDRSGLLTCVAAEGFHELARRLRAASSTAATPTERVATIGDTYVSFGLEQPALFELMFRPDQLHQDDPQLQLAQRASSDVLLDAVKDAAESGTFGDKQHATAMTLICWAFVHGLVGLARDGALRNLTGLRTPAEAIALAHSLTSEFTKLIAAGAVR